MAATTLAVLLQDFVREYAGSIGGRVGVAGSGSTTTVVDAPNFAGPFSAAEWARGSPIRFTGVGNRAGQVSYLTAYDPVVGTLTFAPAVTNAIQANDTFVIVQKHIIDSVDRLIEALNRGLRRHATRRLRTPITEIKGGDLLGTIADFTTPPGGVGTTSFVDLAAPDSQYQRAVQWVPSVSMAADIFTSAANMAVKPGDVVDFSSWCGNINAGSPAGWSFRVRDETNGANITPTFSQGSASTPILSPTEIAGSFVVPAACYAVRLYFLNTGGTLGTAGIQVGPMVAMVRGKLQFATQPPLDAIPKMIGNFYRRRVTAPNEHPAQAAYDEVPLACDVENLGWGFSLRFRGEGLRSGLPFPLYYDQMLSYTALSADTNTTSCPEDLALAAMAYEFFAWADRTERRSNQNVFIFRRRVSLSRWEADLERAQAHLKLMMRAYGSEGELVIRRAYQGRASA